MNYKKEKNGKKGEARTKNILLDHFIVHKIEPDIEGRDFMAELHENIASVNAIIQSKYFEGNNEVLIRKEYIVDEDGSKTEFFALLHSDNDNGEIRYFFTAQEIIDTWRPSNRKKGQKRIDYFVFKLNKRNRNDFNSFKGISKIEINRRIEEGIKRTDEIRNTKNIRHIKDGFKNPTRQIFENVNNDLYKQIKSYPIVDKLHTALYEFHDFRRIISWRLIAKIAFQENRHTSTYYRELALHTNNSEILNFFKNIKIEKTISINNPALFKETKGLKRKVKYILDTLQENLIFNVYGRDNDEAFSISIKSKYLCECISCCYENLNFHKSHQGMEKLENSTDLWDKMQQAYILFLLGNYEDAKRVYNNIERKAKEQNQPILFFFAKYNQKLLAFKTIENFYPDLGIIVDTLNVTEEKRTILNSVASDSLFNSYSKSVDEIYLKIKDFKQRYTINDTSISIIKLNATVSEFSNFFDGNWLLTSSSGTTDLLFEKMIECCIISYSMRTEYSNHLNSFNDFLVQVSVHYCNSNKLLDFFQRNNVRNLPYRTDKGYLKTALTNFFSKENVDFLYHEICYFNHRTKNPDLRRKVIRTFKNLCILITYLDTTIDGVHLLKEINYFIKKLDFGVHEVYTLAHPLLVKPNIFDSKDIIELINIIISRPDLYEGYLLSNCLHTLKDKDCVLDDSNKEIVDRLFDLSIENSRYGILKALPHIVSNDKAIELKTRIYCELESNFKHELFYRAVLSGNIEEPIEFISLYLKFFSPLKDKKELSLFYANSPYTGIGEPLRENLNNLVEVLLIINDETLLKEDIVREVTNRYPYYEFILNIDKFEKGDSFDKFWILENQSEIVLQRIAKNHDIGFVLKEELLKRHNKELSKIFIKYFSN